MKFSVFFHDLGGKVVPSLFSLYLLLAIHCLIVVKLPLAPGEIFKKLVFIICRILLFEIEMSSITWLLFRKKRVENKLYLERSG